MSIAERMNIRQNYLYRVTGELQKDGAVRTPRQRFPREPRRHAGTGRRVTR